MILLRSDCLVFENADGSPIPLSGGALAHELFDASDLPYAREILDHVAAAVVFFFKTELGRDTVTVGEFTMALERVLKEVGFELEKSTESEPARAPAVTESDLCHLAAQCGQGFELAFFPMLRDELRRQLKAAPPLVRFQGLRGCVKQLLGARHWGKACERLSDQIAEYLRHCLVNESKSPCALVVC